MGEDIAGSASHAAHSTDHIVANTPNIAATANIVGTADTELHPNMDRSRRAHTPVLLRLDYPTRAKPEV